MDGAEPRLFDVAAFLADPGVGRRYVQVKAEEHFFTQGSPADCVFYLRSGRAKLTVVSAVGKEATIGLVAPTEFFGEDSIAASAPTPRLATATALTECTALCLERREMLRVLAQEHAFSSIFLRFLLGRSIRVQADLVDQLFNSSEKRLARVLLMLAALDESRQDIAPLPHITQESLAEMIGTTRSQVNFFMNQFRKQGFIAYNGHLSVHKSLVSVLVAETAHAGELETTSGPDKARAQPRRRSCF